jgi:hypothetical protein
MIGEEVLHIPICDIYLQNERSWREDWNTYLDWLNERLHPKVALIYKKCLRHKEFFVSDKNQIVIQKELGA